MGNDELVCLSYICKAKSTKTLDLRYVCFLFIVVFHANLLFEERRHQDTAMSEQKIGLRELMLGGPLYAEGGEDRIKEELNRHLRGLLELMPRVYGKSDAAKQALMEVKRVVDMDNIACKRAMMLYGLFAEQEVSDHFRSFDKESGLAEDLKKRVLPFVTPAFFKESCQSPETFVVLSMMLAEMWGGETLGNWPSAP